MALRTSVLALGVIAAAAPAWAQSDARTAPPGSSETRYCMRIEAITSSRIQRIKCWTRDEWARQGVDLDRDWPEEGVRTIG